MNPEQKKRIEELRWLSERKKKQSDFSEKISSLIPLTRLKFLSFEESDKFQIKGEGWPKDKWNDNLYLQSEQREAEIISNALSIFLELIPFDFAFLFFMNYNFGIVEIKKEDIIKNWKALIDLDGDEFFCYNPNDTYFICIEKTEEKLIGMEEKGFQWIYEMTMSNLGIRKRIETGISK